MRIGLGLTTALFLACATPHTLHSQQPTSPAPATDATTTPPQESKTEPKTQVSTEDTVGTYKLRVNLVQVYVVVRDSAGKPVANLHKEDFQLYDNNKLQAITTFAIEDADSRRERTEAAAQIRVDSGENKAPVPVTIPERFVALTFDDEHLLTTDVAPMKTAANGFIDSIGPSDRVGLFTTSGMVTQDFTSDKELLKQSLLKVVSRAHSTRGTCPSVSYDMAIEISKGDPMASAVLRQQTVACAPPGSSSLAIDALLSAALNAAMELGEAENRNVYSELERVLRLLASKPGERVILLASPGFPLDRTSTLNYESSALVGQANRSNVVINTIDARGLYTPDFGDISERYAQPAQLAGQSASVLLAIQTEKQFVLGDLAYGTGGRFFHNSNDLEGGMKQLGMVPEVSYVLGFSPQNEKMDGHFHALKVTLTGKQKYAVQARRGYYAPKKVDDPQEAEKQEMQEAVFSKDEINDIAFTLQMQYFKTTDGGARLSIVSHIGLKDLRFRVADGKHYNDLNIATVIFDDNGNYLTNSGKIVKLRLLDSAFEKWCSTGLTVKSSFDLKPGKYVIRQVVRDSEGAQMAARNGLVLIPE
jgi:VWFA-related protein